MKVLRGRVFRVAGFLVSLRTADGSELTLDCGLAFTAFKAGDAVTLFRLHGRIVRAFCERTGLMIRLDAINDLEQAFSRVQILTGAIPLIGAKFAASYWRHCWSRRHQGRWGWQLWCLPAALVALVAASLLLSLPTDVRLAQIGWAISFALASGVFAAVFWPGVLMLPHLLIERLRASIRDRFSQHALADAPNVDWACEALSASVELETVPLDMSFLDQPVDALRQPAEAQSASITSDAKVVSLAPSRALDRLTALSEKTAAIQALCEVMLEEHQAMRGDLVTSARPRSRDRPERRARI